MTWRSSSTNLRGVLCGITVFAAQVAREAAFAEYGMLAPRWILLLNALSAAVLAGVVVLLGWRTPRVGIAAAGTFLVLLIGTWVALPATVAPELMSATHGWLPDGLGQVLVALQRAALIAPLTFALLGALTTVSLLGWRARSQTPGSGS